MSVSKLFVYDRRAGKTLFTEDFTDPREAIRARLGLERSYRNEPHDHLEIVVINAESVDQIRLAYRKYFS